MIVLRKSMASRWPLFVILLAAAIWFYRSPYSASDLEIVPDSEEYAIGAMELLETRNYHLTIEGRWLPPRYPPWFSATVILPAYVLFGREVGNAVLPITALGVAGVGCAWIIGRRISGLAGGTFAALTLAALPAYSLYAGLVMTDVPCTALMLLVSLIYLETRRRRASRSLWVFAGVLVALTTLFRNLFAAMLLPFLFAAVRQPNGRVRRLIALLAPMAIAASASFIYNAANFGSPLRNGYKFWVAAPLDYLSLTFSASHLPMNLTVLLHSPFPLGLGIALGAWLLLRERRPQRLIEEQPDLRDLVTFYALTLTPIVAVHLLYFFPAERFFLPLFSATAIGAAALAAMAIGPRAQSIAKLLVVAVLLLATAGRIARPARVPFRRLAAERIRRFTPNNATVISMIDPVYLERLAARGSDRRILPLSRDVEYASKVLVRKRIAHPDPPLHDGPEPRPAGLLRGGGEDAIKFVAAEHAAEVKDEVARGAPVFVDVTGTSAADKWLLDRFAERFHFIPRAQNLYQLALK